MNKVGEIRGMLINLVF
ncbi:hypothetical protein [Clostridium perfringens]